MLDGVNIGDLLNLGFPVVMLLVSYWGSKALAKWAAPRIDRMIAFYMEQVVPHRQQRENALNENLRLLGEGNVKLAAAVQHFETSIRDELDELRTEFRSGMTGLEQDVLRLAHANENDRMVASPVGAVPAPGGEPFDDPTREPNNEGES